MKKLWLCALVLGFCGALDSTVEAGEDASGCSETIYGSGRSIYGGCYQMDIQTSSKCHKLIRVYANYTYEGKDVDGAHCAGSETRAYVMYVNPNEIQAVHINACKCWRTERAWIDDVEVEFF